MKVLLLLVCLCSAVLADDGLRYRRSPFFQRPLTNGITQMSNIFREGVQAQSNIISGGVTSALNQASNLKAAATQTAANAVNVGTQMTMNAISAISTPGVNAMAIIMVNKMGMILRTTGKDVLTLPAINQDLFGFGSIQTSEGTFRRLSSLVNNGTVSVNVTREGIRLVIPVSMSEMRVDYPRYDFRSWAMNLNGSISAGVAANRLLIHVRLLSLQDCVITVDKVEVDTLEGIDVQLTGLCSFCSSIANYIISYLQGVIKDMVQSSLDGSLRSLSFGNRLMCAPLRVT